MKLRSIKSQLFLGQSRLIGDVTVSCHYKYRMNLNCQRCQNHRSQAIIQQSETALELYQNSNRKLSPLISHRAGFGI